MAVRPKHLFLLSGFFLLTTIFILTRMSDTVARRHWLVGKEARRDRFDAWLSQTWVRTLLNESESERALRNKGSNMAVGILVARRERPTIYFLLEHLLREPRVAEDFIIIVHVAYSVSRDEELLGYLRRLEDVVVTVVEEKPYPEAMEENIADTRGDSMERTVWRTTHGEA